LEEAGNIYLFTRNFSTELTTENFPKLSQLVKNQQQIFLSRSFQVRIKETIYRGNYSCLSDEDIVKIVSGAHLQFGSKNVIAILAVERDENVKQLLVEKIQVKREVRKDLECEGGKKAYIYVVKGRVMFFTCTTPILHDTKHKIIHELKNHGTVTAEGGSYDDVIKLNIQFVLEKNVVSCFWIFDSKNKFFIPKFVNFQISPQINLKFVFNISPSGYWKWKTVEYEDSASKSLLYANGTAPEGEKNLNSTSK
jgi:hypothetical protein